MPHRGIDGSIDLRRLHESVAPAALREGGAVIKLLASFLDTTGRHLLVEALVVEGHLRQGFFLLVSTQEGGAMVRIHPRSSPEKTPGVKRAVAWLAERILARTPGARGGTTNLEPEALAPFPPETTD